jgi:hypothetical protein
MATPRTYSASFSNVTVSAAQDLFYIAPAANKPVQIIGWYLTQFSDVGDAAEEVLRVDLIRGHTTVGSGGTSVAASSQPPVGRDDVASAATVRTNDTTIASAGTAVTLHAGGFNIRAGEQIIFTPEIQWEVANGSTIVLRLMAAPADSVTLSGTIYFAEL